MGRTQPLQADHPFTIEHLVDRARQIANSKEDRRNYHHEMARGVWSRYDPKITVPVTERVFNLMLPTLELDNEATRFTKTLKDVTANSGPTPAPSRECQRKILEKAMEALQARLSELGH